MDLQGEHSLPAQFPVTTWLLEEECIGHQHPPPPSDQITLAQETNPQKLLPHRLPPRSALVGSAAYAALGEAHSALRTPRHQLV
jgi:hypothetical protein